MNSFAYRTRIVVMLVSAILASMMVLLPSVASAATVVEYTGQGPGKTLIFEGKGEIWAGQLHADVNGVSGTFYCVQAHIGLPVGSRLTEQDWSQVPAGDLASVTGILHNLDAYAVKAAELGLGQAAYDAGIQSAIWHFSDGLSLTDSNDPEIVQFVNFVVSNAPTISEPVGSVSVDIVEPTEAAAAAGSLVGPYTVQATGSGDVTLEVPEGIAVTDGSGALLSGPFQNDSEFYLRGDSAGTATVVASMSTSVRSGRVFDADSTQALIAAATIPVTAFDQANGEWLVVETPTGCVGDRVWHDLNQDGIQDEGEPGIANVAVSVFDNVTGELLGSTVTDSNGNWHVCGLPEGEYRVEYEMPAGYEASPVNNGDDSLDSDGLSVVVPLGPGEDNMTIDLGVFTPVEPAADASVGDFVWLDTDKNGVQNDGEAPIEGVTVTLYDSSNEIVDVQTTDSNGAYLFDGLAAGTYTVEFSPELTDLELTDSLVGDPALDSNGLTTVVELDEHEHDPTIDLGLVPVTGCLGDVVWHDLNADGVQNDNEPGIAGVLVTLTDADGNELATATTDENGAYRFCNLPAGQYTVTFTSPDGFVLSPANQGDPALDSNGLTTTVDLGPGEHNMTIDLGIYEPVTVHGCLGDVVWYDANANGIQDAGEAGVSGVTVILTDSENLELARTTTDVNGAYKFCDLPEGQYTVTFIAPDGHELSPVNQGDSDVDSNGLTTTVDLGSGEHNMTIDLGIYDACDTKVISATGVTPDGCANGQVDPPPDVTTPPVVTNPPTPTTPPVPKELPRETITPVFNQLPERLPETGAATATIYLIAALLIFFGVGLNGLGMKKELRVVQSQD